MQRWAMAAALLLGCGGSGTPLGVTPLPSPGGCSLHGIRTWEGDREQLDLMVARCDPTDHCELACIRAECGGLLDCRRVCLEASSKPPGRAFTEGDDYAPALRGFAAKNPQFCGRKRGWTDQREPPGPAAELQRRLPASEPPDPRDDGCFMTEPGRELPPTGITEIAIERDVCYGPCPIYWLRLHADGRAERFGKAYVPHLGYQRGTISRRSFEELARLALELHYLEMQDDYSCNVTDNPTVTTKVTRNGKSKYVRHYAPSMSGPLRLQLFEQAIDDYAASVAWTSG